MRLRDYLKLILKSLNPNRHREVAQLPFFDIVKYFFFLFGLCLIVSLAVLAPTLSNYKSNLDSELDSFDEFQVSVNASMNDSLTVLERPEIVVNFDKENITDEWVLVNNNSIQYKKFIFFGEESAVFSDYNSIKSDESASLYSKIVIFLLPAAIFWVAVLFLIKYAILITLFALLGWLFFMSGKHEFTFQNSLKTAVFTATPMIILDLILWPLTILFIIPIVVYLIYYLMGVVMVSDRKYGSEE